jgi:16S rRNA (guanine527-N7)-methyltransferase
MDTARIAALLEPFVEPALSSTQLAQISTYIDLLLRWNARINLTAVRDPEEIVTRHFGESLFLASHLFPASGARTLLSASAVSTQVSGSPLIAPLARSGESALGTPQVLDIGSGAGFPALPLKIWAPQIRLTLIESNHKKAAFLREAARALTLTDINVIADRAETLSARPDFPKADVVTLRAVERFEKILPQAVTFLAPHGSLALLIGEAQLPYLTSMTALKWQDPIRVPQSLARVLSIGVRE